MDCKQPDDIQEDRLPFCRCARDTPITSGDFQYIRPQTITFFPTKHAA